MSQIKIRIKKIDFEVQNQQTRTMFRYNILDYGAVGDETTVNSRSIQQAVDDCAKNGGGKVYIPAGMFLTGTIYLRDNIHLYLENGAVLLGSPRREDYNDDEVAPHFRGNCGWEREQVSSCHLIYARNVRNVGVCGHGTIDGNNKHFWGEGQSADGLKRWKCSGWRPNAMIAFNECENVRLADITVTNATYWTTWFYACGNVKITGVNVLNDRFVPNGDGLSIERCKDVIVNNCIIHTADDAIALRSGGPAVDSEQCLENVVVSNCVLSTPCAAIRLGPEGDAAIRNCIFSNVTIENSGTGIYFSFWNVTDEKYKIWRIVHGPKIKNISFSNMIIDADYPIRMHVNNEQSTWPAYVKNVNIQDIIARARCFCHIESNQLVPFENIKLSNIDLTVGGDMIMGRKNATISTAAFFLKNVSRMSMRNININFELSAKRCGPKAIKIENCREVLQENINVVKV